MSAGISATSASSISAGREPKKPQASTRWYWTAIAISALVLIGGVGIGITGLLQSHSVISLPKHMASAIGTLSTAPHNWGLWTLTLGSFAIGMVGIVFGAYNIHNIRVKDPALLNLHFKALVANDQRSNQYNSIPAGEFEIYISYQVSPCQYLMVMRPYAGSDLRETPLLRTQFITHSEARALHAALLRQGYQSKCIF